MPGYVTSVIEVFKIVKGTENIDKDYFKIYLSPKSNLRGHSFKLNEERVRLDVAKFYFSNRVTDDRNLLSEEIIAGNSFHWEQKKT